MGLRGWGTFILIVLIAYIFYGDRIEIFPTSPAEALSDSADTNQSTEDIESQNSAPVLAPMEPVRSLPSDQTSNQNGQFNLSQEFSNLLECLEINENDANAEATVSSQSEPWIESTPENIKSLFNKEFGDSISTSEDWSVTDVRQPNGELRRVRLETVYGGDVVDRNLRYFSLDAEGLPISIELTEEQSTNPSESLINSLFAGNEIVTVESANRSYYPNGEEVLIVTENNIPKEFDVWKNGTHFKCSKINTAASVCTCN